MLHVAVPLVRIQQQGHQAVRSGVEGQRLRRALDVQGLLPRRWHQPGRRLGEQPHPLHASSTASDSSHLLPCLAYATAQGRGRRLLQGRWVGVVRDGQHQGHRRRLRPSRVCIPRSSLRSW